MGDSGQNDPVISEPDQGAQALAQNQPVAARKHVSKKSYFLTQHLYVHRLAAFTFGKSVKMEEVSRADFREQFDHIFLALKNKGFKNSRAMAAT